MIRKGFKRFNKNRYPFVCGLMTTFTVYFFLLLHGFRLQTMIISRKNSRTANDPKANTMTMSWWTHCFPIGTKCRLQLQTLNGYCQWNFY